MPDDVVYTDDFEQGQANSRSQADQSANSLHATIDLDVGIGPEVKLDYMGVKGKLAGNVHISQQHKHSLQGEGQIHLVDAKYKAYGQNLTIDPGLIVFNQSPLDNPILDIRAIRKINKQSQSVNDIYNANVPANVATTQRTLKVGVHVKGSAQQPEIDLFSVPAGYREADILAMLLTGSSASELQQSGQSALLMEAAQLVNNHTWQKTQSLTGKLVDSIGLEQTNTNSGDSSPLSKSKLTVGKYIRPNLYVSYSVSLNDPSNQVKVRYNLGHNWQIQTEANPNDAGIDLFYTIER
jgi:translocation and assembly module TamB